MRKNHSFTLVELLIALIIIGIITTLVIPQYRRIQGNAQEAEAMTILRALSDAAWNYRIEAGDFPPNLGVLGVTISGSKIFDYVYRYHYSEFMWLDPYGVAEATRKNWDKNPFEEPDVYLMGYSKIRLSDEDMARNDIKFQKIDDAWYRYYWKSKLGAL